MTDEGEGEDPLLGQELLELRQRRQPEEGGRSSFTTLSESSILVTQQNAPHSRRESEQRRHPHVQFELVVL